MLLTVKYPKDRGREGSLKGSCTGRMNSSTSVDGFIGEIQFAGGTLGNNDAKAGLIKTAFISCLKATARDKGRESIGINNEPLQMI